MIRLAGLAVLLVATMACGAPVVLPAGGQRSTPAASPSRSLSPSPSRSALQVSESTVCMDLFPHMQKTVEIVGQFADSNTEARVLNRRQEIVDLLDSLHHDQDVAPDHMRPLIQTQIDVLEKIRTWIDAGAPATDVDFRDYRSASMELLRICARYPGSLIGPS